MSRRNPIIPIALGAVLLVISFVLPGDRRDLVLRIVGGIAILSGIWLFVRR